MAGRRCGQLTLCDKARGLAVFVLRGVWGVRRAHRHSPSSRMGHLEGPRATGGFTRGEGPVGWVPNGGTWRSLRAHCRFCGLCSPAPVCVRAHVLPRSYASGRVGGIDDTKNHHRASTQGQSLQGGRSSSEAFIVIVRGITRALVVSIRIEMPVHQSFPSRDFPSLRVASGSKIGLRETALASQAPSNGVPL